MVNSWFLCGDWVEKRGGLVHVFGRRKTCHFFENIFYGIPEMGKTKNVGDPNQAKYRNLGFDLASGEATYYVMSLLKPS